MVIHLFGDKLRELRKEKDISQEDLGKLCGVAKTTISNWENNITEPPFKTVKIIAKYFNVTPNYLLNFNLDDIEKIQKIKLTCREAGIMTGQDFTIEEFEKAMLIVETLKDTKK